ncbi:hypothetical protein A2U01_0058360, partial [Trifolium medium]|nr:hypothetical protein [Trifolium medium]
GNDNSQIFEATWETRKVVVKRFPREHDNKVDDEVSDYKTLECQRIVRFHTSWKDNIHQALVFEKAECSLFELVEAVRNRSDEAWHENATRMNFLDWAKREVTITSDICHLTRSSKVSI